MTLTSLIADAHCFCNNSGIVECRRRCCYNGSGRPKCLYHAVILDVCTMILAFLRTDRIGFTMILAFLRAASYNDSQCVYYDSGILEYRYNLLYDDSDILESNTHDFMIILAFLTAHTVFFTMIPVVSIIVLTLSSAYTLFYNDAGTPECKYRCVSQHSDILECRCYCFCSSIWQSRVQILWFSQ